MERDEYEARFCRVLVSAGVPKSAAKTAVAYEEETETPEADAEEWLVGWKDSQ